MVNGHTFEMESREKVLIPQPPFVFWNRGKDGFVEVAARACPRLAKPFVGRGGAQADFDRDGRVDLALLAHGEEAVILRNTSPSPGHWLRVRLRQSGGNIRAVGARVYVTSGVVTQMEEVGCSSSYLSQNELTPHFGLGKASAAESVRILWPDGEQEVLTAVPADQELQRTHVARYPVGHSP